MAERYCDKCGKKKPISGGKTCMGGHFLCVRCAQTGAFITSGRKHCPICKKELR